MPPAEQVAADDSENLLEYEVTGFSQPDFLDKLDVSHPLLVARKRLNEKYVHKSMAKARPKRERRSQEIVDIDGTTSQWGQFKRRFEEDRLRQSAEGEEAKNAQFVLNQDQENEKLLVWHHLNGFRSEDSDDEVAIYGRSER